MPNWNSFQYLKVSIAATWRMFRWKNDILLAMFIGIVAIARTLFSGWDWSEPLEEIGFYFVLPIGGAFLVLIIWNLCRARKLLLVRSSSPSDIEVKFNGTNWGSIGPYLPYIQFVLRVENKGKLRFSIQQGATGHIHCLRHPLQDTWTFFVPDQEAGLPIGSAKHLVITQRVQADFLKLLKSYANRKDFAIDFSHIRIRAESERVGPFQASFNIRMPGEIYIAVPAHPEFRWEIRHS